jgi:DNA repair exonuclease SbcCD ATPase subunit
MAEIQAMNMVDATSAISAMLAPEKGQAELDETQPAEESEEETEAAASEEDDSGVEDAPEEEVSEEQSEEEEEQEEQEQPQTFTVKVDGKEVTVTLDELQKGYSRTQDYTRKTQQIAEVRKQVEQETQAVRAEREQYAQLLGALQAQLQSSEPQVDLERLYHEDPIEWVRQKEVMRERQEKLGAIQSEQQRLSQVSQYEQQRAMEAQLASQQEALLAALPDWKDPKKAKAEKALVIESAKAAGFTDEDLKSVYDHRLVLLLRKAALFDQMVSKRQGIKPVVNNGPRPAKPGAAGRVSTTTESTRAKQRLAKTGRVDDAASAIELLLK